MNSTTTVLDPIVLTDTDDDQGLTSARTATATVPRRKHRRTRPQAPIFPGGHQFEHQAKFPALTMQDVRIALQKGFLDAPAQRVDVLDVICVRCRRSADDVWDKRCDPDRSHLIGGPKPPRTLP